jgi:SpoVK/Ycf46/Vps4 family AAA+-type ATPase
MGRAILSRMDLTLKARQVAVHLKMASLGGAYDAEYAAHEIEAALREAQADALREAAEEAETSFDSGWYYAKWLRERAESILPTAKPSVD